MFTSLLSSPPPSPPVPSFILCPCSPPHFPSFSFFFSSLFCSSIFFLQAFFYAFRVFLSSVSFKWSLLVPVSLVFCFLLDLFPLLIVTALHFHNWLNWYQLSSSFLLFSSSFLKEIVFLSLLILCFSLFSCFILILFNMFSLLSSATCCNFFFYFSGSDLVSVCVPFLKCTFLVPLFPLFFPLSRFFFLPFCFCSFFFLFSSCVYLFARFFLCDLFLYLCSWFI